MVGAAVDDVDDGGNIRVIMVMSRYVSNNPNEFIILCRTKHIMA